MRRECIWFMLAAVFCSSVVAQKKPTVEQAVWFMHNTLRHFGFYDQNIDMEQWKSIDGCRIYIKDSLIDKVHYKKEKKINITIQIHLGNVDPESIQSEPANQNGIVSVKFKTTNNEQNIWMFREDDQVYYHKFTEWSLNFMDRQDEVNRFVKAMRFAVEQCGGKPSAF